MLFSKYNFIPGLFKWTFGRYIYLFRYQYGFINNKNDGDAYNIILFMSPNKTVFKNTKSIWNNV